MDLQFVEHIQDPKLPTLFLFHGYGSHMMDLHGLAPYLPVNTVCFQAPHDTGFGGYAWYPIYWDDEENRIKPEEVVEAQERVFANVTEYMADRPELNPSYLLGGFSQGAIMSMGMYIKNIGNPVGIVAMSGYVPEPWIRANAPLRDLPLFQSHGTEDPTIPYSWAKSGADYLSNNPSAVFHTYSMGHSINEKCLTDLVAFLLPFRQE